MPEHKHKPHNTAGEPSVCFVIPTHNRAGELARTFDRLDDWALTRAGRRRTKRAQGRVEVLVIDNASDQPPRVPGELADGSPVRLINLPFNEGASARNRAIGATDADWLVMLDDDSHPTDAGLLEALRDASDSVWAISADIRLPNAGTREMGGLPEVFVGCGVAIRRAVFEQLGGYDPSFGYYAEEYDLSARIILGGGAVRFDPRFRVDHMKSPSGRDMDVILERLARNNGWVMQRYAPETERRAQLREVRRRCRYIADREDARYGCGRGLRALRDTMHAQVRTPMSAAQFDRFTGRAAAREAIQSAYGRSSFRSAAIIDAGKNAWCVRDALEALGVRMVHEDDAEVLVIGTMSPGPMLDAVARHAGSERRVIAPWVLADSVPGGRARAPRPARAG